MNAGILTESGMILRSMEINILERTSTTVVESPIPTPLIADVVTGKIDVRNVEIPDYEFEEELGETEDADDDEDDASDEEV